MTAAARRARAPSDERPESPGRDERPESPGPVHPDRLTVWPMEEGFFGIHVCWRGRDSTMRATVVRLMLLEAGYVADLGNSLDGRQWELRTGPVPSDEVAHVIDRFIW